MTWTYGGDPAANDRDFIRFLLGDTDASDELVSDEEIAAILAVSANRYEAASKLAAAIALHFSRAADISIGGEINVRYSQRAKTFQELSATLGREAAVSLAPIPWAGGLDPDEATPARFEPTAFKRGMHDNPESLSPEED